MTKHDAIRISQLHQIFYDDEGLFDSEKNAVVLYSIGFTVDDIAHFQNVKTGTIQKRLASAKEKLNCVSIASLKPVVLLRMLLLTIFEQNRLNGL